MITNEEMNDLITERLIRCDEGIASAKENLNEMITLRKEVIEIIETENREVERIPSRESRALDGADVSIKEFETNIKLLKIEKMIYNALKNTKSDRAIYKKLQDKYAEAMVDLIELSSQQVSLGLRGEGNYLDFCNKIKKDKNFIDIICQYGFVNGDTILTNWSIPSKPSVICFVKKGQFVYERVRTAEHPLGVVDWTTSVAIMLPGRTVFSSKYTHYRELVVIH